MEIKIPIVIDDEALEKALDKRVAELKQEGDFVLVTRCKDCKHFDVSKETFKCWIHCADVQENDFCSYAEQKEIEEDKK